MVSLWGITLHTQTQTHCKPLRTHTSTCHPNGRPPQTTWTHVTQRQKKEQTRRKAANPPHPPRAPPTPVLTSAAVFKATPCSSPSSPLARAEASAHTRAPRARCAESLGMKYIKGQPAAARKIVWFFGWSHKRVRSLFMRTKVQSKFQGKMYRGKQKILRRS